MEEQFAIISSLPNNHKWKWNQNATSKQFKFEQKFSCSSKYYPGSPRNRILQACCFRDDPENIVVACLENICGKKVEVPYPKDRQVGVSNRRRRPRILTKNTSQANDFQDSDDESCSSPLSVPNATNAASEDSNLYRYYVTQVFRKRGIFWRFRNENKHIILMNGYNCETGNYMVDQIF